MDHRWLCVTNIRKQSLRYVRAIVWCWWEVEFGALDNHCTRYPSKASRWSSKPEQVWTACSRISQTCMNALHNSVGVGWGEDSSMPCFRHFCHCVSSNSWNMWGAQYGWETTPPEVLEVWLKSQGNIWSSYKEIKEKGRRLGSLLRKCFSGNGVHMHLRLALRFRWKCPFLAYGNLCFISW